eukprot:11751766-Ditylum_brightwellii.AAC.1
MVANPTHTGTGNDVSTRLKQCTFMPEPPSIQSFYADIAKDNRPVWPKCEKEEDAELEISEDQCLCATNNPRIERYWVPCNSPTFERISLELESKKDPLRMKTCRIDDTLKEESKYTMEININITRDQDVLDRLNRQRRYKLGRESKNVESSPNILFLEIDSVSQSASLRHMPKTLSLLKSHSIIMKKDGEGPHCPTGFCAASFNKTSVMGQNSIPNQLSALSGCTDQKLPGVDTYLRKPISDKTPLKAWCPRSDLETSPFLFNLVPELGYLTFFGEEFCFSKSPYVIQLNLFKLNPPYAFKSIERPDKSGRSSTVWNRTRYFYKSAALCRWEIKTTICI